MLDNTVKVEWLDNGRDMRLVEPIRFTSHTGKVWLADTGSIINGASIPRIFWTVVGPPFVGLYRDASVIHDVHCELRIEPHEEVHKVFNEIMKFRGVDPIKRMQMYKAVWYFGPKWDLTGRMLLMPDYGNTSTPEAAVALLNALDTPPE